VSSELPASAEPPRAFAQLRRVLWLALVPLIAVLVLPFLLLEIGPSYEARFGGGTPGTFLAQTSDCDDESGTCRWTGEFRSDDGSSRRSGVRLIGGGVEREGQQVDAVDVGGEGTVYPAGGGWNWLITTLFLLVMIALLALWGRSVVSLVRARRLNRAAG
jgi:hypothetical protein